LQVYAINVDCQRNVRKTGMQSTAHFLYAIVILLRLPKFVLMQPVSKPYAYESYLLIDTKLLIER